jgi:hypothetical protein
MLTAALWTALLAAADDQDPQPGRAVIQGAVIVGAQPASSGTYQRVSPNLSGHSIGIVAEAGAFLSKSWALEGEFVFGAPVSVQQLFSYSWREDYIAENRDLLLTELVRWKPGGDSHVEFVGGGGVAITRARKLSHTITYAFDPNNLTNRIPDESVRLYGLTFTGGADAVMRVSQRVAFVPTFRVRWIRRPEPAMTGWNGIGAFTYQFGAGVRARF